MTTPTLRSARPWLVSLLAVSALGAAGLQAQEGGSAPAARKAEEESLQVHYLEIVTPDVEATCGTLAKLHGVEFGEPVAGLGNARTAPLAGGWRIGVRAPMHEQEEPVVRPYVLVEDLAAAVEAAQAAGGEVAVASMEIPGEGLCAIYFQGGIEHGLWEL